MNKFWEDDAWEQYLSWQDEDEEIIKKINDLILEIDKSINKLELSKNQFPEFFSRNIDEKNRLIYRVDDKGIHIFSCKGHKFILGR